ncbi:MAG TPA: hypothetical protein DEB39_10830, partial [Planctomycetaceae bacterium]|nr:hypothetical protein [Planctomycetaceae bacterium]
MCFRLCFILVALMPSPLISNAGGERVSYAREGHGADGVVVRSDAPGSPGRNVQASVLQASSQLYVSPAHPGDPQQRRGVVTNHYGANRFGLIVESQPATSVIPRGGRQSFFQKIEARYLFAPSSGSDGLEMNRLNVSATCAVPLPNPKSPLLVTPLFSADFLSLRDKDRFDMPDTLYSAGVSLLWMKPVGSKTVFSLGVSPTWSSDFEQDGADAMRVPVHFGLLWLCNPRTRIMIGAAYLDRNDYPWIPFVGLTWTPSFDWHMELGVPRTRISKLVWAD